MTVFDGRVPVASNVVQCPLLVQSEHTWAFDHNLGARSKPATFERV